MTKILDQEFQNTLTTFRDLIRINTTNPPGNEIEACKYLAKIFDDHGIPYQILESAPTRANIIARLKGDGSKQPLLLTSHLDVVPCENEHWEVDPFAATIKDDMVWGRGTVDMKQMTAMELCIFLKAHKEKLPLKRDVIFAAVADEEAGCHHGSKWLVENHPDLVRAEYALNEVGGFSLTIDDQIFYPIGVAEKGLCWFEITAKGRAGHGAMPHDNQAIQHLCFASQKLAGNNLPFHNPKIVTDFIYALASKQSFLKKLILKGITKKSLSDFFLSKVFPDKDKAQSFYNMLHNTATTTMLKAGYKENVIPGEAKAVIDGRILPEQTIESFLQEIQNLIGPNCEIKILDAEEANQTDYDNDFFETLVTTLKAKDPGCLPIPFLIPGFTDAKHYAKLGIKCYGFAPTKLPADLNFGSLYHGHNERLPVESLRFGSEALWDVLLKTCC